jgi:hypothetical protein
MPMDFSQEMICQKFLDVEHTLLDPTDQVNEPIPVGAMITGYGHALNPDQIWIEYKTATVPEWSIESMVYQGAGQWLALIPGQAQPDAVGYYVHAEDILGRVLEVPSGGRDNARWFDVAWKVDLLEEESGWIVDPDGDDTASDGIWERAEPESTAAQPPSDHTSGGTLCWITGAAAEGSSYDNDVDGGKTTLQSPVYDLTGVEQAIVKYWRWYTNHHGWLIEGVWIAQVRNNGGPWIDVENPGESVDGWLLVEVDLSDFFGDDLGEVEFRFIISDQYQDSLAEGAIDDFEILVDGLDPASVVEMEQRAGSITLAGGLPNPFRTETSVQFWLPTGMPVNLSVYNAQGQRVRTLLERQWRNAGRNVIPWSGEDDAGRRVRSGVYFIRLDAEGETTTHPVTVLK